MRTPRLVDAADLLVQAMFMLEMHGDGRHSDCELASAAHSMVQRALGVIMGREDSELTPVTTRGLEIVAEEAAISAIEDAQEWSKRGA